MKTELHVPSDIRFLIMAEDWLLGSLKLEVGETVDWSKQSARLRLALAEAYSNVVRHAHREQPHLPVVLCLEIRDRELALEIWDLGEGYDPESYRPPSPEERQEHGYGWMILNRLMDRVEYQPQINGRNCLKLAANLPVLVQAS
jgi:serine/threonine-protein kinase RsbW